MRRWPWGSLLRAPPAGAGKSPLHRGDRYTNTQRQRDGTPGNTRHSWGRREDLSGYRSESSWVRSIYNTVLHNRWNPALFIQRFLHVPSLLSGEEAWNILPSVTWNAPWWLQASWEQRGWLVCLLLQDTETGEPAASMPQTQGKGRQEMPLN